jgi:hypothetical protein
VIVEGVYSMEGEACCLRDVVAVAKAHKAYVYLDEAHSIGALGPSGRGCCEHWGVDPASIDVMMGTFTKSFGSCGGYIAGRRELVEYLRRHSPAHLYACAMAPGCVRQVTAALEVIMGRDGTGRGAAKIKQLHDNANYVRRCAARGGREGRLVARCHTSLRHARCPPCPHVPARPVRSRLPLQPAAADGPGRAGLVGLARAAHHDLQPRQDGECRGKEHRGCKGGEGPRGRGRGGALGRTAAVRP